MSICHVSNSPVHPYVLLFPSSSSALNIDRSSSPNPHLSLSLSFYILLFLSLELSDSFSVDFDSERGLELGFSPMTMRMEQRTTRFNQETKNIKGGEARDDNDKKEVVHKVDLSGLCLDSLPCSSLNLASITRLDLSNNNLQTIPESLTARLLNLVSLDAHSNQLISLPNSVGCLSKLKTLNVSGNLLESIPRTIEDCKSLEELILNFNKLTKLPDTIGFELENLKTLSVNSNKLTFLPYSTSHLTNLRYLDARLNCLQSLPDELENLIRLQTLNVSQNFQHLTSLPPSVGLLLSLTDLDISYNSITVLPDSLGCLIKLQSLHAEGNPLVCPPMDVVEQSVDAVRTFLCERMKKGSSTDHDRRRKRSWIGRLVKFPTFSVGTPNFFALRAEKEDFLLSDYRSIDGHATPRNLGMFSPRRLFSPRRSKSGK